LCGATGGGKSNLLRLLLAQLLGAGASVVLADPHFAPHDADSGDDWQPIADRLTRPPAVDPRAIADLLGWLTRELDARLERRRRGREVGPSLFLAFDELPVIVEQVKGADASIGRILREGRKVRLLTIGASQEFLVKTIGGSSAVRDCYRTAFYVGGDVRSGAALLDLPQRAIDDGALQVGLAYLRSTVTSPAQIVRVPYASNAGVRALLGDGHADLVTLSGAVPGASTPGERGDGTTRCTTPAPPIAPGGAAHQDALSPRQRALLAAMARGEGTHAILHQVYGVDTGKRGSDYKAGVAALRDDQAAIARLLGVGEVQP
jgi:hypothetical protein